MTCVAIHSLWLRSRINTNATIKTRVFAGTAVTVLAFPVPSPGLIQTRTKAAANGSSSVCLQVVYVQQDIKVDSAGVTGTAPSDLDTGHFLFCLTLSARFSHVNKYENKCSSMAEQVRRLLLYLYAVAVKSPASEFVSVRKQETASRADLLISIILRLRSDKATIQQN